MPATLIRTVVLAIVWSSLQGSFDVLNLIFGGLLGISVTIFSQPIFDREDDLRAYEGVNPVERTYRFVILILVFLRELFISSFRVARITVAPTFDIRSGVVKYPLDATTDREITALANLITLTPGTMTLDSSPDKKHLYIHSMSLETDDGQEVIDDIKSSLEKHVRRVFGPANRGGSGQRVDD